MIGARFVSLAPSSAATARERNREDTGRNIEKKKKTHTGRRKMKGRAKKGRERL